LDLRQPRVELLGIVAINRPELIVFVGLCVELGVLNREVLKVLNYLGRLFLEFGYGFLLGAAGEIEFLIVFDIFELGLGLELLEVSCVGFHNAYLPPKIINKHTLSPIRSSLPLSP
jgi:hypothetical protein